METKICEKGKECNHFLIEHLIRELGGLGDENGLARIKSAEEFRKYKQKIKKLYRLVSEFETEVVTHFNAKGFYPCADPMEIAWGRRKYLVCIVKLRRKKILKLEAKK